MAGYVTQSRNRSKTGYVTVQLLSAATPSESEPVPLPDEQSTYSFRSGKLAPSESDTLVDDSKIFRSSSSYFGESDTGHEFWTQRTRLVGLSHPAADFNIAGRPGNPPDRRVRGPILLTAAYTDIRQLYPSVAPTSGNDVKVMGTRMINATIPTKPAASLSTFFGELKNDGLPSLFGSILFQKGATRKSIAGEYLNLEFGIKPLLSDVRSIAEAVRNSSRLVQQMKRDSGRVVRRRFSVPTIVTTSEETRSAPYYDSLKGPWSSYTTLGSFSSQQITDEVLTSVWFSGAYTYFLDPGDSLLSKFARYEQLANQLLGTRLTESALWELAPWSWLADWFADIGLVLSNASQLNSDGLVIKYGYLMVRTRAFRTVSATGSFHGVGKQISVTNSYVCERKERFRATPYGFGLNLEDFSPRQWAILGALGLSKEPGRLSRA